MPQLDPKFQEGRMTKRRQFLLQHMNVRQLNVEIDKDVSAFYDKAVAFTHVFLSDFVSTSLYSLLTFKSWNPNEV